MRKRMKQNSSDLEIFETRAMHQNENTVDADTVLSQDDLKALKEAESDLKNGRTKRL